MPPPAICIGREEGTCGLGIFMGRCHRAERMLQGWRRPMALILLPTRNLQLQLKVCLQSLVPPLQIKHPENRALNQDKNNMFSEFVANKAVEESQHQADRGPGDRRESGQRAKRHGKV
ncbi:hypothetical protein NQZ68_019255 [Dissostichus eleginoides]|nr:hypothetical protein NQZ68_019255 [Dissostichus eleginoides]